MTERAGLVLLQTHGTSKANLFAVNEHSSSLPPLPPLAEMRVADDAVADDVAVAVV